MSTFTLTVYGSAFTLGLLSGAHCAGMCGGIVTLVTRSPSGSRAAATRNLIYNLGRIGSYSMSGALAGALGAAALGWHSGTAAQTGFMLLASAALIVAGLQLAGMRTLLLPLERVGIWLWRRIQPYTGGVFPPKSNIQLLMAGMLWGYLPCGLVYSALLMALASGGASDGATVMLAFGLGTLPNLLLAGWVWQRMRGTVLASPLRRAAGIGIALAGALLPLLHLHQH